MRPRARLRRRCAGKGERLRQLGEDVDLKLALAYAMKSANEATGIPFPIDLVDDSISIDRMLAKEFADEIEARLEPLNPQKEE